MKAKMKEHPVKPRIIDINSLSFEPVNNQVEVAKIDFDACEAKVLHYKAGYEIPPHHHTTATLKVILKGNIEFPEGAVDAGSLYGCGGHEYQGSVKKDTYILLLQQHGTEIVYSQK